jgi:hypothetical protein
MRLSHLDGEPEKSPKDTASMNKKTVGKKKSDEAN